MQPVSRKRAASSPASSPDDDDLDPGQRRAVKLALDGHNLFITGGPGAGKSHALRRVIRELEAEHPGGVLVTAPTGVAALLVGGQTLHTKPGPGIPKGCTAQFGNMLSRTSRQMWLRIKVLVVDEVRGRARLA